MESKNFVVIIDGKPAHRQLVLRSATIGEMRKAIRDYIISSGGKSPGVVYDVDIYTDASTKLEVPSPEYDNKTLESVWDKITIGYINAKPAKEQAPQIPDGDYLLSVKSPEGDYLTLDNGATPFRVVIADGVLTVFQSYEEADPEEEDAGGNIKDETNFNPNPVLIIRPTKVWIGEDPDYPGNSILLETDKKEYIYIGTNIKQFDAFEPIVEYFSPVGNSQVPYPYAVDSEGNYYLLIENVTLRGEVVPEGKGPYEYYYENNLITKDNDIVPLGTPDTEYMDPLGGPFQNIEEFYSGKTALKMKKYTLRFDPDYETKHQKDKMAIKRSGKKKRENLTHKQYVDLMEDLGEQRGMQKLNTVILVA